MGLLSVVVTSPEYHMVMVVVMVTQGVGVLEVG